MFLKVVHVNGKYICNKHFLTFYFPFLSRCRRIRYAMGLHKRKTNVIGFMCYSVACGN